MSNKLFRFLFVIFLFIGFALALDAPTRNSNEPDRLFVSNYNPTTIYFTGVAGAAYYDIYWGPSANGTTITSTNASPQYDPVGLGLQGTYYLRVRAQDGGGVSSNWEDILVYQYIEPENIDDGQGSINLKNNLEVTENETTTVPNLKKADELFLTFRDETNVNAKIIQMKIKKTYFTPPLSTLADIDYSGIYALKNGQKSYLNVPSNKVNGIGKLANELNDPTPQAWIEIKYFFINTKPIIKYDNGGGTIVALTDYYGNIKSAYADRIRNFDYQGSVASFEVAKFSAYGTAYISTVNITQDSYSGATNTTTNVQVQVIDTDGNGVENAPVSFNIVSGDGSFSPASVTTDANGYANITYTFGTLGASINAVVDGISDNATMLVTENVAQGNGNQPTGINTGAFEHTEPVADNNFNSDASSYNADIIAYAKNIIVLAGSYSKNATEDGRTDWSTNITKIRGLAKAAVFDGMLNVAYNGGIYKNLTPGTEYSATVKFVNRGNAQDSYNLTSDLTPQTPGHWTKTTQITNINVEPWQVGQFTITINPTAAASLEKATLNFSVAQVNIQDAVSYNAFAGAYLGGTYLNAGEYGGDNQTPAIDSYTLLMQTEGFDLTILDRIATINSAIGGQLIPGAKVKYSIVVKNNSSAIATSVNVTDIIPGNCHLYYTVTPDVTGASSWEWAGATDNNKTTTDLEAVKFIITIPANGIATSNYTVTID